MQDCPSGKDDQVGESAKPIETSSHWGLFRAHADDDGVQVSPSPFDSRPTRLIENLRGSNTHRSRVLRPAVRAGWLQDGPSPSGRRGEDSFVEVDWDSAVALVAGELARVYRDHGAESVYGGSYGWASAGRFHHSLGQLHRFLNCMGGYVSSHNSYSAGASEVLLPWVAGLAGFERVGSTWDTLASETRLFVCFGGLPSKNLAVNAGGVSNHSVEDSLVEASKRGCKFVLVSPLRDDLPEEVSAQWLPIAPGTDTAFMLGVAHELWRSGLHDVEFLSSHTVGFEPFLDYLSGKSDGIPKTPEWASSIAGLPAGAMRDLAREMSSTRTFINTALSLQRAERGEQPIWMGLVLACMLGQIGLPGGGYGHSYGSGAGTGMNTLPYKLPTLEQGINLVAAAIPVARVSDMLLSPGQQYDFNGERRTYPHIRLAYWAGGNPFHHHQDLMRFKSALSKLETFVVHESVWTATAKHADIVLPASMSLERSDIGCAANDELMVAMKKVVDPPGVAESDFSILRRIAAFMGHEAAFSRGMDEPEHLEQMYSAWRDGLADDFRDAVPDFSTFWELGSLRLPGAAMARTIFQDYREDPDGHPLQTPSGKFEIWSQAIESMGYEDCPPHPAWLVQEEGPTADLAARLPLVLVANNPGRRLHSQLDFGAFSQESKVDGREPLRMHPADAAHRDLIAGQVVEVFNDRGSCLAGLVLTTDLRQGVVQLSTGAWFDPRRIADGRIVCVHGNPNVLTRDVGTSKLAQATTGQLCLVDVRTFEGDLPEVRAYDPPPFSIVGDTHDGAIADDRPPRDLEPDL